jgi:hypothetical protein
MQNKAYTFRILCGARQSKILAEKGWEQIKPVNTDHPPDPQDSMAFPGGFL